jgi:hypothetical protein
LLHDLKDGHESKKVGHGHQDKAFAEIKSSATLSLGRIEHSNFSGFLENLTLSFKEQLWAIVRAYTRSPSLTVTAALTGISLPFSSFAFVTLNTERTDEATMKSVASTK